MKRDPKHELLKKHKLQCKYKVLRFIQMLCDSYLKFFTTIGVRILFVPCSVFTRNRKTFNVSLFIKGKSTHLVQSESV